MLDDTKYHKVHNLKNIWGTRKRLPLIGSDHINSVKSLHLIQYK